MKISKTKLRQIIKEELGTLREQDPAEIDALAYERLFNAVGDLIRTALEEDGLRPVAIQMALAEAVSEELGPVQDEEETIRDDPPGERPEVPLTFDFTPEEQAEHTRRNAKIQKYWDATPAERAKIDAEHDKESRHRDAAHRKNRGK